MKPEIQITSVSMIAFQKYLNEEYAIDEWSAIALWVRWLLNIIDVD